MKHKNIDDRINFMREDIKTRSLINSRLVTSTCESGDNIIIHTSKGVVVQVRIDEKGRTEIHMKGADLYFKNTEKVRIDCNDLSINTKRDASIKSNGKMDIISKDQLLVNSQSDLRCSGERILLNCDEI